MKRCALVLLLLVACGGGGNKATTTTTVTPTTEAPTTTTDPRAADLALTKAMWRAQNLAWKSSNEAGIQAYLDSAWPPGEWTAEMFSCVSSQRLFVESIVDDASFEPDPTFTLPTGDFPGAGQQPPGRIYIMHITTTTDGQSSEGEAHVSIIDGKAFWFPIGCT